MDGMALTEDIFFFARGAEFFRTPVTEIVTEKEPLDGLVQQIQND